jgi:hypothetical protein
MPEHNYNDHPVPVAPLSEAVVIDGYDYWRGATADGACQVTVLQSRCWSACERYIETLIGGRGSNLYAHPAWKAAYAAAHDAEVWRHHQDGVSCRVEPLFQAARVGQPPLW